MALERLFDATGYTGPPEHLYLELQLPKPPPGRSYVFANMVATVDGKTLIAPRGSTAKGVGGSTDHLLMRRLEDSADAAIIGSGTLRVGNVLYPPEKWRAVITSSGDLPVDNRFFTDAPDRAIVFAPKTVPDEARRRLEEVSTVRIVGGDSVEVAAVVRTMRTEFGVERLLLEGGPSTNWEFLAAGVLDELFLTLAPKLKGGRDLPTVIDGAGFPDREVAETRLMSLYRDGDELYLRYSIRRR